MSTFKQFMEAIEYRVNDAWEHLWPSYTNGQVMGYENSFATLKMVFNRENHDVIEITACSCLDADKDHAYRWINPDYKDGIQEEAESRNVNHDEAWEGFKYVDLEVIEDLLEKGCAMLENESFDERVVIPLELDDEVLMALFRKAHEQDITFNQLIHNALEKAIAEAQPKKSVD